MRLVVFFFLFSLLSFSGFSQIMGDGETYLVMERINPTFQGGGIENFTKYINREFDYSKVTQSGKQEATFTIDEEGSVTKIKITQVLDIESATEMIRVLKKCPKWEPAKRGGKPISVEIKYPMVFSGKAKPSSEDVAQKPSGNPVSNTNDTIYELASIESAPRFNGGLRAFYQFIASNYNPPDVEGLKGKVIASFVIERDGSITDIKVLKEIGFGTGAEAIRVLKLCPKWAPAKQNGIPVRCSYQIPINIKTR